MWFRKKVEFSQYDELLADQIKLLRRVKDLSDDLEKLQDQFTRLRGLVYARKLHKPGAMVEQEGDQAPANPTANMSRDELRRHLGLTGRFVPGKPPVHT